jgi:hypothetical protein
MARRQLVPVATSDRQQLSQQQPQQRGNQATRKRQQQHSQKQQPEMQQQQQQQQLPTLMGGYPDAQTQGFNSSSFDCQGVALEAGKRKVRRWR